ncbi:TolC family protein [Altererythrobacter sp. KTW20L]|uniref:TolC family protein n=1 Tax=Altererythrobacter sp. KTW20L TaxID=2942210 RepID=UPI0020BE29D6|nr:TolC family protein [Altererythrobacter sp. KTW20L]MCL6250451.1 TolC family protein [Altererythrobacter sp. KTW20L]
MPKLRMRHASLSLAVALCAAPSALAAQEALTEQLAIERALAREGIADLEAASRDIAATGVELVRPFDNPSLEVSRESVGGEREWQLGIVQPIDLSGQRDALRNAARSEVSAVESDIAWARIGLIAQVRSAFVSCAAAGAELAVWQNHATALAEAERIAGARAREGDTAVYDLRRTRVAASSADAELSMAEGERAADCASLASLTGLADPVVPPTAITSLRSGEVPGDRADLAAQEQRLLATSQRVVAARRSRVPQFSVGAGIKHVSDGMGSAVGPAVSVGVTLPIFDGGGAAVSQAQAQQRALQAELAIARRTVEAEQQAAAARANAAREAAVRAARSRDDAARLGQIAAIAYQSGEIGVVELLDAHAAQRDAELAVIRHATAAAQAAIAFDLATGRTAP